MVHNLLVSIISTKRGIANMGFNKHQTTSIAGNIMRKLLFFVFFLMSPLSVWAWTTTNHMNAETTSDGWYMSTGHPGCTPSINSNQSASTSPSNSFQIVCTPRLEDSMVTGSMNFVFPSSTKEIWMQYYFKYSSNYDFHQVGDKHIYFWNTDGSMNLANINGSMWGLHRLFLLGDTLYDPNTGNSAYYELNVWNKVVVHLKLNSIGSDVMQLWLNDKIIMDYSNATIDTRSAYRAAGFGKAAIDPVWGGQVNPPVNKSVTDYQWYDYVIISTDPIGGISGGENKTKNPGAPSSVVIH